MKYLLIPVLALSIGSMAMASTAKPAHDHATKVTKMQVHHDGKHTIVTKTEKTTKP